MKCRPSPPSLACLWLCLAASLPAVAASSPDLAQLSLPQAVELLRNGNHSLGLAGAAVTAASADLDTAGERPNPELSLSTAQIPLGGGGGNSGGLWQRPYDTIVSWQQPIERGGKRALRQGVAKASLSAAGNDRSAVLRQQLAALYAAYYALLEAQQKQTISRTDADSYQRSVAAAEKRLQAGDIASADVARLRVDAYRSENDARQAESDREQARFALARLLGVEGNAAELGVSADWPALGKPDDGKLDDLVAMQPEVRAAQARVDSTRQAVDLARAQQSRDVTLSLQYEHEPPGLDNSVGVGVSVPIMLGSDYHGEIRRAEADLETAELSLDDVRSQTRMGLAAEHDNLLTAAAILGRFRGDVLSNAKKAADAAEFAYNHGASGLMDLLDARRTLHAVQMDALDAEAAYAQHLATWQALISPVEQ